MGYFDRDFHDWLIEIRRDFHKHPELSFKEHRTTGRIKEILEGFGVETQFVDSMPGVIGLINGKEQGPTIGLRADIDALPMTELNDHDYKSCEPGQMHACGHDVNTTIMIGVARRIMESRLAEKIKGQIKFIFQPAEEIGIGAKHMIEAGVLEHPHVDCILAGHMSPDIAIGSIGVFEGLGYASADRFKLEIIGKGGHGAQPDRCLDPILAGSHFVSQVQSIVSRNVKPTESAVITVGKFHAGTAANVIPQKADIEGSIRTLSGATKSQVFDRLKEMTKGLEMSFKVVANLDILEGPPVLITDPKVSAMIFEAAKRILGEAKVNYIAPIMGSEDFVYFAMERPSSIIRLGCSNKEKGIEYPLHSPYFDVDEDVLKIGTDVFYESVKKFFEVSSD